MGLRGGSVSFGTRGLHYTVGTSGSRITAGLPGTGLFWTQKLSPPWGTSQASGPNQPPSYSNPITGAQPAQLRQPSIFPSPIGQVAQSNQLAAPQVPLSSLGGGSQSFPTSYKHVFVPQWMVWAVLAVMVIGGLCLAAATIGKIAH